GAKVTLQEAVAAVGTPFPPALEPPPPLFNPTTLLWPAGLAIFGFLIALMLKPLLADLAPGRRVAAEEEEEEDEEEEEVAEAAPAEAAPAAEVPMAQPPTEMPPVVDVPMAEAPPEAAVEEMAVEGDVPLAPPPVPAGPSALSRTGVGEQVVGAAPADPKKTMMAAKAGGVPPTMLARKSAAVPTMLARPAPAKPTMITPTAAMPTKVADSPEPMALPTGKTQKK